LTDLDQMRARRPAARREVDLCSGPAKLCQALGIDRAMDSIDLCDPSSPVRIIDDGVPPPRRPGTSTRIGLRAGADRPWRWYVAGEPNVSRRAPVVPA
jgi:DNA-3-methyladenine glycosylase